jgi:hypothetical protein
VALAGTGEVTGRRCGASPDRMGGWSPQGGSPASLGGAGWLEGAPARPEFALAARTDDAGELREGVGVAWTRAEGVGSCRRQQWRATGGLNGDDGLRLRVEQCKSMGDIADDVVGASRHSGASWPAACEHAHRGTVHCSAWPAGTVARLQLVPRRDAQGLEWAEGPRCQAGPR